MLNYLKKIATAACILSGIMVVQAMADDILLQSEANQRFVREADGVMAASGDRRSAQRFEIVRLDGRKIALRLPGGSYLRAGVGQATLLAAGSPHIRGWETFELMTFPDARIALRSVQNGRFVTINRAGLLSATADIRSIETGFRIVDAGRGGGPIAAPQQPPRVDWTGRWSLVRVAARDGRLQGPPHDARLDFSISRDRIVAFSVGCNRVSARLNQLQQRVSFDRVISTKMLCQGPVGRFERAVIDAFDAATTFENREGQIAFLDRRGRTILQIGR